MKRTILSLLVICGLLSSGLVPAARSAGGASAGISPAAPQLAATLDRMDVDHHWLPGMTIEWRSGKTLHPATEKGVHTHCSAFVAAACEALGAPMLSPPPQAHLANRQQDWLLGEGRQLGWTEVHAAQAAAVCQSGQSCRGQLQKHELPIPLGPRAHCHDPAGPQVASRAGGRRASNLSGRRPQFSLGTTDPGLWTAGPGRRDTSCTSRRPAARLAASGVSHSARLRWSRWPTARRRQG